MTKSPELPTIRKAIITVGIVIVAVGVFVWFFNIHFSTTGNPTLRRLSQSGILFTYAGALFLAYDLLYGGKHAAAKAIATAELSQIEGARARCARIKNQHSQELQSGNERALARLLSEEEQSLSTRNADASRRLQEANNQMPKKLLGWVGVALIAVGTLGQFIGIG